jgi:hypothetical protein
MKEIKPDDEVLVIAATAELSTQWVNEFNKFSENFNIVHVINTSVSILKSIFILN